LSTLISVNVDEELNLRGYLAINSTVNGSCHGGLRMAPDLSPESIAQAARVMTLKYGFVGLPVGGAKAGIVADPEITIDRKRELLTTFGQAIKPFLETRSYIPSNDLGITDEDIRFMLASIGLKNQPGSLTHQMSGFYTGITVCTAAMAAARYIGLDLNQASVAIEGFGNVGTPAARMFWERGIRVVAISTIHGAIYNEGGLDIGELLRLSQRVGNQVVNEYAGGEKIDKGQLAELDVDILCPCAHFYSIHSGNVSRVAARIISPGANVPFTPEAGSILFQRGILTIPDFAANCGGVLGASMKRTGLKENFIRNFLEEKIGKQVAGLIGAAEKENVAPQVYGERVAEERFHRAKASAEGKSIKAKAFHFALELYRNGFLPHQLVTPFAAGYFEKKLK